MNKIICVFSLGVIMRRGLLHRLAHVGQFLLRVGVFHLGDVDRSAECARCVAVGVYRLYSALASWYWRIRAKHRPRRSIAFM